LMDRPAREAHTERNTKKRDDDYLVIKKTHCLIAAQFFPKYTKYESPRPTSRRGFRAAAHQALHRMHTYIPPFVHLVSTALSLSLSLPPPPVFVCDLVCVPQQKKKIKTIGE
jgi:hypothetical protein